MWLIFLFNATPQLTKARALFFVWQSYLARLAKCLFAFCKKRLGFVMQYVSGQVTNVMLWYQNPRMAPDEEGEAHFQSKNL